MPISKIIYSYDGCGNGNGNGVDNHYTMNGNMTANDFINNSSYYSWYVDNVLHMRDSIWNMLHKRAQPLRKVEFCSLYDHIIYELKIERMHA